MDQTPVKGRPKVRAYTLFYFSDDKNDSVNITGSHRDRHLIYIKDINTLNASLRNAGINLTVLTNRIDLFRATWESLRIATDFPDVEECLFSLVPPSDIRFFSAHFKIEVFNILSVRRNEISILLDSDMISLRPLPDSLMNRASDGSLVVYEITDQVGSGIRSRQILADLRKLDPDIVTTHWFGGEFICGTSTRFRELYNRCLELWPIYCKNYRDLHHQGDEMVVSAALLGLRRVGVPIVDAGELGIVRRFWSVKTKHVQLPLSGSREVCLLHLPADKNFLANVDEDDLKNDAERFWKRYRSYSKMRSILSGIKATLSRTRG